MSGQEMIRSLYPTDLISLLFFSRRVFPNHAITRDRLGGASMFTPQAWLEHWFPWGRRRHTWVWPNRGRILGVISTKNCSGPTSWQIDYLRVGDEECCLALLDKVSAVGAEQGVKKLFLRLPQDSPLVEGVRRSGFSAYSADYLYRYGGEGTPRIVESPYTPRPRSSNDDYRLFELYCAAVPAPVRTAEGMTFEEWQASRDRGSWPQRYREYVWEKEGRLVGWLRISSARGMGCFEVMLHPAEGEGLEWLVNRALESLDGKSPLFCVASAFQGQLRSLLPTMEFEEVAQYCALVKELALRVREPSLMPMQA